MTAAMVVSGAIRPRIWRLDGWRRRHGLLRQVATITALRWITLELADRYKAKQERIAADLRERLGREPTEEEIRVEMIERSGAG